MERPETKRRNDRIERLKKNHTAEWIARRFFMSVDAVEKALERRLRDRREVERGGRRKEDCRNKMSVKCR